MRLSAAALITVLLLALVGLDTPARAQEAPDGQLPFPRLRVQPDCTEPAAPVVSSVPVGTPTPIGRGGFAPVAATLPSARDDAGAGGRVFDQPAPLELRILGSGFEPGQRVLLAFFEQSGERQDLPDASADQLGTFDVRVTVARPTEWGRHQVRARLPRMEGWLTEAALFTPCRPAIAASTTCRAGGGGDAGRLTALEVRGSHWPFAGKNVELSAREVGGEEIVELGVVAIGEDGAFRYELDRPGRLRDGRWDIRAVVQGDSDWNAVARIELPCATPGVRLAPECSEPGRPSARWRVRVTADGFSPGAVVLVIFDPRRSHEVFATFADDGGRVDVQIRPLQRPAGEYVVRVLQDSWFQVAGTSLDATFAAAPRRVERRVTNARFTAPCPVFEEEGVVEVRPACTRPALEGDAPREVEYRVTGSGFRPGPLLVRFDAGGSNEETYEAVADESGAFEVRFSSRLRPRRSVPILAEQTSGGRAAGATFTVTATTVFTTPCNPRDPPPLELEPACGLPAAGRDVAYRIDVSGSGFYASGRVFLALQGTPQEWTLEADEAGVFAGVIEVPGLEPGEHELRAVQREASSRGRELAAATGIFTVPCALEPSIEVLPASGPAGYTTQVRGQDFPPGSQVVLRWDRGIEAGREFVVEVLADGTFAEYLLILPNDLTGERSLSAVVSGQAELYPEATADYMVAHGPGIPPQGNGSSIVRRR